jgi:hypothetical protein
MIKKIFIAVCLLVCSMHIVYAEETKCDSHDNCYELYDSNDEQNQMRFFYSKELKINKFNIMKDYLVKIRQQGCPLKFDVYKINNNMHILLDTIEYSDSLERCVIYVTNLTGKGVNRDKAVSQLEVKFCPQNLNDSEQCDKGLVSVKVIDFMNDTPDNRQNDVDVDKDIPQRNLENKKPNMNNLYQVAPETQRESINDYILPGN